MGTFYEFIKLDNGVAIQPDDYGDKNSPTDQSDPDDVKGIIPEGAESDQ